MRGFVWWMMVRSSRGPFGGEGDLVFRDVELEVTLTPSSAALPLPLLFLARDVFLLSSRVPAGVWNDVSAPLSHGRRGLLSA